MPRPDGQRLSLTRRQRAALRALLIGATAAAGRAGDRGALNRLARAAPIEVLPAAAALHSVGGTVLRGLDGVADVPADVRRQLGVLRERATLDHLLVTGTLGEIGRAFDEAGLSWVVMKGPAVATLLYPEPGDRSYTDLDLLIDRREFPRAVQLLEELGFQHDLHNWARAEEMMAGEIPMSNESVIVDLHWHLHYSPRDRQPFALDPPAMLERRRVVSISGVFAPTLDPVDTLLTLAFHAAKSDGHRLVWLKDIERSVTVEAPDLDELVRRCHEYRCGPPVGAMLRRAGRLLDAAIPDDILQGLITPTLRMSDDLVTRVVHPIQFDEDATITRAFTRSIRSSTLATVSDAPMRIVRSLRRRFFPPLENETDDPNEKASYLTAVATGVER